MVKFEGKWKYQSYRPNPGSVAADPKETLTFVPWSPPDAGVVTIDQGGTTGTLDLTLPNGSTIKLTLQSKSQREVLEGCPSRQQ